MQTPTDIGIPVKGTLSKLDYTKPIVSCVYENRYYLFCAAPTPVVLVYSDGVWTKLSNLDMKSVSVSRAKSDFEVFLGLSSSSKLACLFRDLSGASILLDDGVAIPYKLRTGFQDGGFSGTKRLRRYVVRQKNGLGSQTITFYSEGNERSVSPLTIFGECNLVCRHVAVELSGEGDSSTQINQIEMLYLPLRED
jgi:hypothetical protein